MPWMQQFPNFVCFLISRVFGCLQNAIKRYTTFHCAYYALSPLIPVSPEQLAQFVELRQAQSLLPSAITSYVSAIAYVHKIKGLPNPGKPFKLKKTPPRSQCIDKRHPSTLTQIRILITALPSVVSSKYECILFSAMFFTAFFALLRVGEFCLSSTGHQNKYMLCQPKIIDVLWAYVFRWALKVPYFSRGLLLSNHNRSFLSRDLSYIH